MAAASEVDAKFTRFHLLKEGSLRRVYSARSSLDASKEYAWCEIKNVFRDEQEARWLRRMNEFKKCRHEHLLPIYGAWRNDKGTLYYVTDLMDENSCMTKKLASATFSIDEARRIGRAVLQLLASLHHKDIIHGNISLSTVFIDNGKIKVGDLAFSMEDNETVSKMAFGKQPFAAQELNARRYNITADMFSFGILMSKLNLKTKLENIDKLMVFHHQVSDFLRRCKLENRSERPTAAELLDTEPFRA